MNKILTIYIFWSRCRVQLITMLSRLLKILAPKLGPLQILKYQCVLTNFRSNFHGNLVHKYRHLSGEHCHKFHHFGIYKFEAQELEPQRLHHKLNFVYREKRKCFRIIHWFAARWRSLQNLVLFTCLIQAVPFIGGASRTTKIQKQLSLRRLPFSVKIWY